VLGAETTLPPPSPHANERIIRINIIDSYDFISALDLGPPQAPITRPSSQRNHSGKTSHDFLLIYEIA